MSAAMPAKKYLKGFQSCTKVTSHLARVVVGQRPDMVYRPPPRRGKDKIREAGLAAL